ncbi:RNA polymerase sigma factor [Priestia megaterium]|uniref:RNA polymerase sigma factor n=1 Tax=Priestia megaterium TaxID=1404 RepID=UPI00244D0673|nr:RNA polymerase sigma factor [Priestia megaterium]MDH2363431.1 RNA polymerase sigma factor [Priestia megaterium]
MENTKKEEIERWYDDHSDAILKFILILVKDYQQAEDLTHETFVKAYLSYDSFQQNSSGKTWLFRIAHNLTIDYFRKQKPISLLKDFILSKKDNARLPEETMELKETSLELYQALGKLKDSHRKVILLRKVQGFSVKDTASILNWSESKVKSTQFRAIPALRKQLVKDGYVYEETI